MTNWKSKPILIICLMVVMTIALLLTATGCYPADPLTEDIYFTNVHYEAWEEETVPAPAMGGGWPAPTTGNCQAGFVYLFPDEPLAVNETFAHFTVQMPHSYKEGTNIYFTVHFVFNSDQVGTKVRWRISYSWANAGSNFPVSANIWALSDPANNDSLKHQVTRFATSNGVGKAIGSELLCYVSRNSSDVTDDYTDTAILTAVSILYQVDAPGSRSQWVK